MSAGFAEYGFWLAPVIGVTACGLAYLIGRRYLVSKPRVDGDPDGPLSADFLHGVTRERRGAPRRNGTSVEVQLLLGQNQDPIPGWVLDRSIGGLGILTEQELPNGAILKIRPRSASEATPWTDVTVRSCRRDGTHYEVGFQFHRTPNWSLLLQFG